MNRPRFNRPQVECNKGVTDEYYIGKVLSTSDSQVFSNIEKILESVEPKRVYIGITSHPCGRFTGYYEATTSVPTYIGTSEKEGIVEDSINEAAHIMKYSRMYLICCSDDVEYMRELEQKVIEHCREKYPEQIINDSDGGEGNFKLDMVYLYVCISNEIL